MAIKASFNGASIGKPGAYSKSTVSTAGGFPLAPTGVVGIVGEASGGQAGVVKTFTSEDVAALLAEYRSGPIADAALLLLKPARDARVPNGASVIRVYKTNASTRSSRALENAGGDDLLTINSANFGSDENLISIKVEAGSVANARVITIQKGSLIEALAENLATQMLSVQYVGADSACTYQIAVVSGVKTLVLNAGTTSGHDLSIPLAGKSIQDLVDIIHNHGGTPGAIYSASTSYIYATSTQASRLDFVPVAADVKTAAVILLQAQQELVDLINAQSSLVTATLIPGVGGVPTVAAKAFLQGAVRGASSNASFQAGFDALLVERCNTVVPLISRDATALAPEGLTDPASSFTVTAVNLQAVSHAILASNTKNRSERNVYLSIKGSFAASRLAAQQLGSERASMCFQDVQALDASGNLVKQEPWAAAAMLAGIQAGTEVGTPATFKIVNALGTSHQDYNEKTQVDLAIDAGLLPLENAPTGGIRVVVHNSTYGRDANFVYNRPSVLEAADYVAYNLRSQLEAIYVGGKVSTTFATDLRDTIVSIMNSFLRAQITVGDDTNNGLGFKDLLVTVNGNIAYVDITVTPVQGVDFILNRITLDTISQSA